jgi:hypothetical protein
VRPPAVGKAIGSGRDRYAGSSVERLAVWSVSSGASVNGSNSTIAEGRSGAPTSETTASAVANRPSNSVYGESTSPTRWPWRTW